MLLAVSASAQSRFVTLTLGTNKPTDQITIGTNEVVNIVSTGGSSPYVIVAKDNFTFRLNNDRFYPVFSAYQAKTLISGPATLSIGTQTEPLWNNPAFVTIEIIPESFPPDKTIIIPADTKGAYIIMEASTDLIHWTNASPGLYTQTNDTSKNLFFRLRGERLQ